MSSPNPVVIPRAAIDRSATFAGSGGTHLSSAGMWCALFAALLIAYYPSISGTLLWDDDAHVTVPALRSLSGLGRIWFEIGATQQYYPVLHSAFWLEHRLWGDAALGYHLANLSLHAIAAVLFFRVLNELAVPGAFFATLLFAFHPVQVESVAWISEQKNTLSTGFYLAAALAFLRGQRCRSTRLYLSASGFFLLGLLAKSVTATLPATLLVITWWRFGRFKRRDVTLLAPWFVIGIGAGLFTAWVEQKHIGAEGALFDLTIVDRCLLAGRVVWFYIGKLFWPANLTFIYPRWQLDPGSFVQWTPLLLLAGGLVILWRQRHGTGMRGAFVAVCLFGISLFPVLGFFNVYPFLYSYVADHFQYLASMALFAFAGGALARVTSTFPKAGARVAILIVAAFALITWRQTALYQNATTLFRATLARNPACWMAHNNLGKELLSAKPTQAEAIACFERALTLRPDYFEARNNLGLALTKTGRSAEAIPHLEAAAGQKPDSYQVHNNLGIALASIGRATEALAEFNRAAALNPTMPNIQENWAKALLLLNRQREADEHFATAARLRQTQGLTPIPPISPLKRP